MSDNDCLSPIGLDCCSCCLDLANGCDDSMAGSPGLPGSPTSPTVNHFRQLRSQLMYQNLNTDKLNNIMRQDSLDSVVRDPCFLLNEGICNSNIDQTMLSILLFFHSSDRCDHRAEDDCPPCTDPFRLMDTTFSRAQISGSVRNSNCCNAAVGAVPREDWNHCCVVRVQPLHLEAKMGHTQTRPAEVALFGATPPCPRTLCALRLAEPAHGFCCHYRHFSYPERAMSYSPPYSPSLFKRPDRR
ncbi:hypothetical protein EYF80_007830 [Liparis tanakae]|uniref:TSC22 domain family protein 3 n=1 Tax=Liparis tanakae TaxID=230148 RepID=A0A4Z2IXA3_9TELE|nr:hypothetical protein EYF80_007830 [Liparis tanakae]